MLALVVSVILLFSLEQEKLLLQGLTQGNAVPTELFPALWQSRHDLIVVTLLVFLVSAIGIAAVITFLHYDSTKRTLEEVKGLARNILESIPTGVLTVNPQRSDHRCQSHSRGSAETIGGGFTGEFL